MASPTLPPLASFSSMPMAEQLRVIDTLFEQSPELHELLRPILSEHVFTTYGQLIDAIYDRMTTLYATSDLQKKQALFGILGSHPRLGASSPSAQANLSELSRREQANINKSTQEQASDQAARLSNLNREYEEKYPGLRYVYVFATTIPILYFSNANYC